MPKEKKSNTVFLLRHILSPILTLVYHPMNCRRHHNSAGQCDMT